MIYVSKYTSSLGEITLASDDIGLIGLWFKEQKYFADKLPPQFVNIENEIIKSAKNWLDIYFSGQIPNFIPPVRLQGTAFQLSVWEYLKEIPYAKTTTYGEIARQIAKQRGLSKMSARAVGSAIGRNPVSIIVPCHRVIGANGDLTGYAGGLEKKIKLLKLEGLSF